MKTRKVRCDLCGKRRAAVRRVSRSYGKGATLLVIENVPVVTCPDCGESYFTPETLRAVEQIKLKRAAARRRPVPVVCF